MHVLSFSDIRMVQGGLISWGNSPFTINEQYYRLSMYRDYIWYEGAHITSITMIKLWSDLHSRTTPHTSPLRARYGVSLASYTKKNDRDISRAHPSLIVDGIVKLLSLTSRTFLSGHILVSTPNNDVIDRKHFPRYWPLVRGIHRSPVNSPQKGQ